MSELGHAGLASRYWSLVDGGLLTEPDARAAYAAEKSAQARAEDDDGRVAALQSMMHTLLIELDHVRQVNRDLVSRVMVLEALARRTGRVG